MKFAFLSLVLVALVGIGGLGYTGFVPVVSDIMGTNKPKNLAVVYNEEDLASFFEKIPTTYVQNPELAKTGTFGIAFDDFEEIDTAFTSQELTASVNDARYPNRVVSDVQIRVGDDGKLEVSGIVNVENFFIQLERLGTGFEAVNIAKDQARKYGFMNKNIPVYVSSNAKVSNNVASVSVESVKVGNLSVPLGEFDADVVVTGLVNNVISSFPGFFAEDVSFDRGELSFKGRAATKVYTQ